MPGTPPTPELHSILGSMVGNTGGDFGASEASWSSCCLLWLGVKQVSANMARLVSKAGRAVNVLDPMIVGVAIGPELHINSNLPGVSFYIWE